MILILILIITDVSYLIKNASKKVYKQNDPNIEVVNNA